MTEPDLVWRQLKTAAETRPLQAFACTEDRPRTQGGRFLPHPKPWEWEAQRHLRQLSQHFKYGDLVVVGLRHDEPLACAHLLVDQEPGRLVGVFVAAAAVGRPVRGQGGAVADALMHQIAADCAAIASAAGATDHVISGKIHVRNIASQLMAQRAGMEPNGLPAEDYQLWARIDRF